MRKLLVLILCVTAVGLSLVPAMAQDDEVLVVRAAYSTPIEEPWNGVIHEALLAAEEEGQIDYEYVDNIGYSGDMERVLRELAEEGPDLITGDSFGNEEAARRVARDYPEIPFVMGSGLGPAEPNFAVFDNWIHEPAYLSGLIAGSVTESDVIGVVGGYPVPEVNRIVNAFTHGVHEVNPDAEVLVTFINSWFDPAAAKESALAQIDAGADVLFAERFGVIEAAEENDLLAFSNMSDQHELAPETVITGPVWNMTPTFDYVLSQIAAGVFTAQDLKDFSMMGKGGASLAPLYEFEETLDPEILELVETRRQEILDGLFRVPIEEEPPANATTVESTGEGE